MKTRPTSNATFERALMTVDQLPADEHNMSAGNSILGLPLAQYTPIRYF